MAKPKMDAVLLTERCSIKVYLSCWAKTVNA